MPRGIPNSRAAKKSPQKRGRSVVIVNTIKSPKSLTTDQLFKTVSGSLARGEAMQERTGERRQGEKSGGPVSYYLVQVNNPNQGESPYQAECGDVIENLGMTFNEGCAFKAIWRTAAARTLGKIKDGHDPVYDAEKVVFYGQRMKAELKPKNV